MLRVRIEGEEFYVVCWVWVGRFIAQTGIVAAEVQMAELSPPQREADESGQEHKLVPDPVLERKKAD